MAIIRRPVSTGRVTMATRKKPTKKAAPASNAGATKKAATKKAAAPKAASKKAAAQETPAKKASSKKQSAAKVAVKKASAKKAAVTEKPEAKKSPFGQKFLDAQEQHLLRERARYQNSAQTWRAEADSLLEGREPGDVQFDEESGDGDTLAIERERDLALSNYAGAAVEEIDEALKRVKDGVYGICVTSGKPIPKDRLEAIPWAAERVEYKVAGFRRR
jgi:RNA polymerase-binding transcription factor DksA